MNTRTITTESVTLTTEVTPLAKNLQLVTVTTTDNITGEVQKLHHTRKNADAPLIPISDDLYNIVQLWNDVVTEIKGGLK